MSAISGHNQIVLRGDNGRHEEVILSGAATPGMNVVRTTAARNQEVDTAAVGASKAGLAGGTATVSDLMIVKERALLGETIDDAVPSGERAGVYIPGKGDVVLVLALSGEDIDKEEGVSFNAAGKAVAATINTVAKSLDDTGGALAADTHIRIIIL